MQASRRRFLKTSAASAFLPSFSLAQTVQPPMPRPDFGPAGGEYGAMRAVESAKYSGPWSAALFDAQSNTPVLLMDAENLHPPASVAKTLTSLYALEKLGADYQFQTTLMIRGAVKDGVLEGDLILKGGADPGLDSDDLAGLVLQLKDAGITQVNGQFYYDDRALSHIRQIDTTQPAYLAYNPAICGLNLNYNRIFFEWLNTPKTQELTLDARARRYRPKVDIASIKAVDRSAPIFAYVQAGKRDLWSVASGAIDGHGGRWLPVRAPGLYAAKAMQVIANAEGVTLGSPKSFDQPMQNTRIIAAHKSAPLRDIAIDMMKYSTNLTAEVLGLSASGEKDNATLKQSAEALNQWAAARFGLSDVHLVDHSGLGGDSRISAADLARVQAQSTSHPIYPNLLRPVYLRGRDGRPIKDHPVQIAAKTGTLNFTSTLSGIINAPDGRKFGFAIMMADIERRDALRMAERENPRGGKRWLAQARRAQRYLLQDWADRYCA